VKKSYSKGRQVCKVTFSLPKPAVSGAKSVVVVGDFNDWGSKPTPLKPQKDGSFATALELEAGRTYRFRYLIDGKKWENDWAADRYEASDIAGAENSVVEV
jgi:1,4-alpha-glucan branching enzyme